MIDPSTAPLLLPALCLGVNVIAVAAITLGGGSDSPCNTPDEPTEPGGC